MKKLIAFTCFSLFFFTILPAQEGVPLLTHFKESREIENQNWAICQDENSIMLFANRRGIMTFNGLNWSFIKVPSVAYSLEYNSSNKLVYAGCDNNYGYLKKDRKGIYQYISMSGDSAGIGLISKIMFTDSTVIFYSDMAVCRHDLRTGKLESRIDAKGDDSFSGMFGTPKNTFVNIISKGLHRVEADTLFPIVTGYITKNEDILFSLPYSDKMVLLGLSSGSLSLFDGIKFYEYMIRDEGYLMQNILSFGITISDSLYAFSTLDGGALVVEKKSGKIAYTINYQNGLPDDEVFAMTSDNKNGLWLSHQFGLSRADLRLPVSNFGVYPGLRGNLTTSVWHNNELYVATSEGVYYLEEVKNYSEVQILVKSESGKSEKTTSKSSSQNGEIAKTKKGLISRIFGKKQSEVPTIESGRKADKNSETGALAKRHSGEQFVKKTVNKLKSISHIYKKVDGLSDKCKQLVSTPYGILASTNRGLYNITGHSAKAIVKDLYINAISAPTKDRKYYIATSEGYFYIIAASGSWKTVFPDRSFNLPLYSIAGTNNNVLWAGGTNVAYRITKDTGSGKTDYKEYSVKNDYPNNYMLENVNDTVFLVTESGINYFDESSDSFKKYKREELTEGSKLYFINSQPGIPWFIQGITWVYLKADNRATTKDKALLNMFDDLISIDISEKFIWLVTGDNQLYRINRLKKLPEAPDLGICIRSVSNEDGQFFELDNIVFRRGDNNVYFDIVAPEYFRQYSVQYQYLLDQIMDDWSKWSPASTIGLMPPPGNYTLRIRARDIWGNISEPKIISFTLKAPFTQTKIFYIFVMLAVFFIVVFTVRVREKQLKRDKQILEQKVRERTAQIEAQKEEITSSIAYASRIQHAMLPVNGHFEQLFSEHFVFFKPRDIVSGDFYWIGEDEMRIFITVADCTGHGVPGAFMSTLGISTLNEIITNKSDLSANEVLGFMREKIKTSLHQTGKEGEASDGMDITFCVLHKNRKKLEFAGAYNPLFLFQNGVFKEYKADRMPIGIYYGEKDTFTNHEIIINKGDTLYLFSDGFVDQFGGPDGVKYKISNLKKLLSEINLKPMSEQHLIILNEFEKWKGTNDQVDDVTIIGIRI